MYKAMTLYIKYRPQTIEELDLSRVREQMKKFSASIDKIPHAFLFSGPRGAGKTSAARILAKIVNCEKPVKTDYGIEPCNICSQCKAISSGQSMDVVELDTASNRGIDDIRALRENIALSPASARKKIYIMDEAHMLTIEAANAFLKTLEEPPSHAIFILATTDPHKLPETILSRLAPVNFYKADDSEIERQLVRIIKGEGMDVENGVIELIARRVDGSFREAVKILEALALNGKVTKEATEDYLYSGSILRANDLFSLINNKDVEEALRQVQKFADGGGSIKDLIDELQLIYRQSLLDKIKKEESPRAEIEAINILMEARGNLGRSAKAELPLEIAVIELSETETVADKSSEEKPPSAEAVPHKELKKKENKQEIKVESTTVVDASAWSEILAKTRVKNTAIEALLRTAKPLGISGNTFELAVYYQFHKERLEKEQYRSMVEGVIGEVLGISPAKIACKLLELPAEMRSLPAASDGLTQAPEPDIIQAAKEIFGG